MRTETISYNVYNISDLLENKELLKKCHEKWLEGSNDYWFIDEAINKIYRDEIKYIVEECYDLNLDNMPSFVEFNIDWEETANNCLVDGYGHTFSGYDGSEEETNNFYYFKN